MKKAERFRLIPFLCAFFFLTAAGALWFGARRVERRETTRQQIPALQAELAGRAESVPQRAIEAAIDRPLRLLAGSESRIDITLSAEAAEVPGLKTRLMSEVLFVEAAVPDGTAFFPLEPAPFQGSVHARIRPYPNAERLVGEWTLTELFFDSEAAAMNADAAFDRWVRVSKALEIDVVRFMGLDAAGVKWLVWGLAALAAFFLIWGVFRRLKVKKANHRAERFRHSVRSQSGPSRIRTYDQEVMSPLL